MEKLLKLYETKSTTNMHMFDEAEQLRKYETPESIIDSFVAVRNGVYVSRKAAVLKGLEQEAKKLSNKARFITENLDGTIDLRRKKNAQVVALLGERGFDTISDDESYGYLVKMPMNSVTEENVARLLAEKAQAVSAADTLRATSEIDLWLGEINDVEKSYGEYTEMRARLDADAAPKKSSKKIGKKMLSAK